jgi:MFS family permease
MPVIYAVQYVNFFNFSASLFSAVPISRFGQRKALMWGQIAMCLFLAGIVVSSLANLNVMVIVFIILFIGAFQLSFGPIAYMHCQETCVDVAIGMANQGVFLAAVVTSILTSYLVEKIGVIGMFSFFLSCSLIGAIYIKLLVKDTLKSPEGQLLNDKQKKELYWPEEFKSQK